MRVLFLDVDGVLNSSRAYDDVRAGMLRWPPVAPIKGAQIVAHIDTRAVALLNDLHGVASIVVSSAWRAMGYRAIRRLLAEVGVKLPVVAITPTLQGEERWREIDLWLKSTRRRVDAFAIVDDDASAGGGPFAARFVRTEFSTGLTRKHVDRLRSLLLGEASAEHGEAAHA